MLYRLWIAELIGMDTTLDSISVTQQMEWGMGLKSWKHCWNRTLWQEQTDNWFGTGR